jgi:hypothetical protein
MTSVDSSRRYICSFLVRDILAEKADIRRKYTNDESE